MERKIEVGILALNVIPDDKVNLHELVHAGKQIFDEKISRMVPVDTQFIEKDGTSMAPGETGYPVLDFVQVGLNEKTERQLAFLIIVTDAEVAAASLSYFLALPSQLTNVSVISTRRLADYGSAELDDTALMSDRLATLMLQCFGRMLNLPYTSEGGNYMTKIEVPEDLDALNAFTPTQYQAIKKNLPKEANDQFSDGSKPLFVFRHLVGNLSRIVRGAFRANPFKIALKLPTMIATALSVIVILIFGAETWDFASAVTNTQLSIFAVTSFLAAGYLLYRSFSFNLVSTRNGKTSESAIVTAGATFLAILLTMIVLFLLFAGIMYSVVVFVFPDFLMDAWTSTDRTSTTSDHIRLVVFLAAVGVLSGSLGGSADSRSVVRNVLFGQDET